VPDDGQFVLTITDAIYRGREDFVYRITIGQLPMVTSIFPLGSRVRQPVDIQAAGWNLSGAELLPPAADAKPGVHSVTVKTHTRVANPMPFRIDTLPECRESEPNNRPSRAQQVEPPIIVNGRIDRSDDWDVFQIQARAGDNIVAEVYARRLDSPLDSLLKVTDSAGHLLSVNDDHMDATDGLNTHHADSYLSLSIPKDGTYFVHVGDTARDGGQAFSYRLRISAPRPDFALRVVPSSINIRGRSGGAATVYAIRRDGFNGPIKIGVEDLPAGLSSAPVTIKPSQESARIVVRTRRFKMEQPANVKVVGRARIADRNVVRWAVPAEDRMQAFLWRHLVPARELKLMVVNPTYRPAPTRPRPPKLETPPVTGQPAVKFSEKQVAGRLRQLGLLFDEWLLTDDFYSRKVAQCQVGQSTDPLVAKKKPRSP
jgi:hypothetical protein